MAHPVWQGQVVFGLVSIPVTLYSAERRNDLHFHLIDSRNQARVHYERINDDTGEEVPWHDIVKGFEYDNEGYVLLKDEDFERAAPKQFKSIDIEEFVHLEDIEYLYFERPYYIVPEKGSEKVYVLLRESLKEQNKVGIAKSVIRSKQYLSAIIPTANALVLNLLRFKQELHDLSTLSIPDKTLSYYKIGKREIDTAKMLIDTMSAKWQPEKYHDEYRASLMQWIEEKIASKKAGKKVAKRKKTEASQAKEGVVDFMALLKKSIQKNKQSKQHKPASRKTK